MRRVLFHTIWIIAIVILYGMMFLVPLPPQFESHGILISDEILILAIFVMAFFAFRQKNWIGKYISLILILAVFALPMLRLWETAESTWNIILGLLPWADATGYYLDANRLIEGNLLSVFSGRRPLFASLLAVLLKLDGQNLQLVLIMFTALNGLAAFLFAEEIRDEFGPGAAILTLYLARFFYHPYAGTTLTEQLGFPIGLLAFTTLIRGIKSSSKLLFAIGLSLLTFALFVRAGAFFILVVLLIFGILHFTRQRRYPLQTCSIFAIAIIIPILLNTWLGHEVAAPNTIQFGNFADTLYGQAMGGKRWTQAAQDHPELITLKEPERSQEVYHLAIEEIIKNPLGLVKGSLKAWKDFLFPNPLSAFSFLTFGNKAIDLIGQLSALLLFLIGIWLSWKNREKPLAGLILMSNIGTFLSVPFLPPIDAGIRPYAATIATIFLPIILIFPSLFHKPEESSLTSNPLISVKLIYSLGLGLLLLTVAGGLLLKATAQPIHPQSVVCQPGLRPINIKLTHGSYILLSSLDSVQKTQVPVVLIKDVLRSFDEFPYGDFAGVLRRIKRPMLVAVENDLSTGTGVWVIAPPEIRNFEGQIISACAEPIFPQYAVMQIKTFTEP